MGRSGMVLLVILSNLCPASGCKDMCNDSDENGSLAFFNDTPYHLHFLHPDENVLYIPPGKKMSIGTSGGATAAIVIAPGQEITGRADVGLDCCDGDCGSIWTNWGRPPGGQADATDSEDPRLFVNRGAPPCGGEGSCPYVYSGAGDRRFLEGEVLVGALNRGARRSDTIVLSQLSALDGKYVVRIANRRDEVEYIDSVSLHVFDHPRGSRIVKDSKGNMTCVFDTASPLSARDSEGIDWLATLRTDDGAVWEGRNSRAIDKGRIRDWIDLEFDHTRPVGEATLLVRGRNTASVQDAYHDYMLGFGPGLPKLMRLTSTWHWYRPTIESLLDQSGLSLQVSVWDRSLWKPVGVIKPVGVAGPQTVALPFRSPERGYGWPKVRVSGLPGAWLIDSVKMSSLRPSYPKGQRLRPLSARMGRGEKAERVLGLIDLDRDDGRNVTVRPDGLIDLEFVEPPMMPGTERTAALQVTGYYEERDVSSKPCINWRALAKGILNDNSFARFMLKKLAWEETVNGYMEKER